MEDALAEAEDSVRSAAAINDSASRRLDAYPDRPDTAMSVAMSATADHAPGQGESGMMAFVQSYMTSILQPFADNVDQLHSAVGSVTNGLHDLGNTVHTNSQKLEVQTTDLSNLRSGLQDNSEKDTSHVDVLAQVVRDKENLEADYQVSKNRISELEGSMAQSKGAIEDLQQSLKDARSKLATLIDNESATERELVRSNARIDRLTVAWEKSRDEATQSLGSMKLECDINTKELRSLVDKLSQEASEHRASIEHGAERLQQGFRETEEKHSELHRKLQLHAEGASAQDDRVARLQDALASQDTRDRETRNRLNKAEASLTDVELSAAQFTENIRDLMDAVKSIRDVPEMRNNVSNLMMQVTKHGPEISALQAAIGGVRGKTYIQVLQGESLLSQRRSDRIEMIMGLEPLTMDNLADATNATVIRGVVFKKDAVNTFQETFEKFDEDGSGEISTEEIQVALQRMGHDPPMDLLQKMVDDVDLDKSGQVCFEEFCILCGGMLDENGKVDANKMMETLQANKTAPAKQRIVYDTVMDHSDELQRQQDQLQHTHAKTENNVQRLSGLEADTAELLNEVNKLRKGLDLNKEYWKGLSKGLKETKSTVHREGEGEMLPSGAKYGRNSLPPLSARSGASTQMPTPRPGTGNINMGTSGSTFSSVGGATI